MVWEDAAQGMNMVSAYFIYKVFSMLKEDFHVFNRSVESFFSESSNVLINMQGKMQAVTSQISIINI